MPAIVSAWRAAREQLEAAGVDTPVIDARLLLESALGASRAEIIADPRRDLSGEETARYEALVARRVAREPVSRILGRKGFWKIDLEVTPDVLTPRPETETLLDVTLPRLPPDARILDFGVGSGAILLALLAERRGAWGVGLDISPSALAVARRNAETLGLRQRSSFVLGDWAAAIAPESVDVVVGNPPYIETAALETLPPEVRDHEPWLSLDGGMDGLDSYRRLAPQVLAVLRSGGLFAVEIDPVSRSKVDDLFRQAGAESLEVARDLAGRERVLFGRKKSVGGAPTSG